MLKFNYPILLLLVLVCDSRQEIDVKVSVFYKPVGHESKIFVVRDMFPTYKYIGQPLKINLVPYEEPTKNNRTFGYSCKHEDNECYSTAIHACVITMYSPEESTEFVTCAMGAEQPNTDAAFEKCSYQAELKWNDIQMCYKTEQYQKLLLINDERVMSAGVTYFPTIIINDKFDQVYQDEAVFNFKRLICGLMLNEPEYCKDQE